MFMDKVIFMPSNKAVAWLPFRLKSANSTSLLLMVKMNARPVVNRSRMWLAWIQMKGRPKKSGSSPLSMRFLIGSSSSSSSLAICFLRLSRFACRLCLVSSSVTFRAAAASLATPETFCPATLGPAGAAGAASATPASSFRRRLLAACAMTLVARGAPRRPMAASAERAAAPAARARPQSRAGVADPPAGNGAAAGEVAVASGVRGGATTAPAFARTPPEVHAKPCVAKPAATRRAESAWRSPSGTPRTDIARAAAEL
mmetsp:Transcript_111418/g.240039  ORF Transcript_111418/g.240039 Transcript_111418/m.240039 type:complete len:258 (+) Transcript_111418:268-1041(+)